MCSMALFVHPKNDLTNVHSYVNARVLTTEARKMRIQAHLHRLLLGVVAQMHVFPSPS